MIGSVSLEYLVALLFLAVTTIQVTNLPKRKRMLPKTPMGNIGGKNHFSP